MPQTIVSPNDLTGGLLSERLDYRTNYERRSSGMVECKNADSSPQGGVDKRPGAENVGSLTTAIERIAAWDSQGNSGSIIGLTNEETGHKIISSDPSFGQLATVDILGSYVNGVAKKTRFTPLSSEAAGGLMVLTNGEAMPYHIEVVGRGSVSSITEAVLLAKRGADDTNYTNYGRTQSSLPVFAQAQLTEQHIAITDLPSNTHASVNALNIKNLKVGELRSTITFGSNGEAISITNNVRRLSTGHFTIQNAIINDFPGHFEFTLSGALPNGIAGINVYVGNGTDLSAGTVFVERVPGRLTYGGTNAIFEGVNQIQISFRNAVSGEVATWNNGNFGPSLYANGANGAFCWNRNFTTSGTSPTDADNPTGTIWRVRATGVTGPNAITAATGITGTATGADLNTGGFGGYQACLNFNSVAWNAAFGSAHTGTSSNYTNAVWHLERSVTIPDIQDADFVALGTTYVQNNRQPADLFRELVPGLLEAVYIRGNEYFTRDVDAANGLRKLPYAATRPVAALYVNTSINNNILDNFDQYISKVLPSVKNNTHTGTKLISEFLSLGQFFISQATITHPPLIGPLSNEDFTAAQSSIGADYCIDIPDNNVEFYGQHNDAIRLKINDKGEVQPYDDGNGLVDAPLPDSPVTSTSASNYYGGKINTQQKLDAEKDKQKFKMRVEPARTDEVYRFQGKYCMQWNPRDGFPICAALWDNRLVYGNSRAYKNRLWFSAEDKKFNFIFRSKNLNINTTTTGRAALESDSIVDTFYGMQYDLDTDDGIQILRASNSLIAFCYNSEHIISGRINANDKTWTRSQQFGSAGTRGNIGVVNIDKKLFTHNGQDALGLQYIDDQSGYDDINLSARFNEDIFKTDPDPDSGERSNDQVVRIAGGVIRDIPSAYQVYYGTESGRIKVFHTLRNSDEGRGFYAWSEWRLFEDPSFGTRKLIDMVLIDRRLMLLDNLGGLWYMNPKQYHDDSADGQETLPIEVAITTTSLISFDVPGQGWVFPKMFDAVYVSSVRFSEDINEGINASDGRGRNEISIIGVDPRRNLPTASFKKRLFEVDRRVGTSETGGDPLDKVINGIDVRVGKGMRKTFLNFKQNTYDGFEDPLRIRIVHKGRGPFTISRIDTEFEIETKR